MVHYISLDIVDQAIKDWGGNTTYATSNGLCKYFEQIFSINYSITNQELKPIADEMNSGEFSFLYWFPISDRKSRVELLKKYRQVVIQRELDELFTLKAINKAIYDFAKRHYSTDCGMCYYFRIKISSKIYQTTAALLELAKTLPEYKDTADGYWFFVGEHKPRIKVLKLYRQQLIQKKYANQNFIRNIGTYCSFTIRQCYEFITGV